jgi:hypothetical protein
VKPSDEKLCENNLDAILVLLKGLKVLREQGGFGEINLKVKDELVSIGYITIQEHIPSVKEVAYRA